MLSECGENMDREAIRVWVVARNKVQPTRQKFCRNEHTASKTIDSSDDQGSSTPSSVCQRGAKLRTVPDAILTRSLYFFVRTNDRGALPRGIRGDRRALCRHP